ncbi:MAG: HXXEE domain-containing protein [Flavobacteriaceae bacterium]
MSKKIKILFFLLIMAQGLHSIEEYQGKLWENFPPATYLTGLFSDDHETGFLIINIGLFVFGLLCCAILLRTKGVYALALVWFWVILEFINGIGHPIWSAIQASYTPGLLTAPLLLLMAVLIYWQLRAEYAKN